MDDRRGDWEQGVDQNLASLNAGQRVHDREVSRLWKAHADNDAALRGDPERGTDGLLARAHQQENEIALLKAVIFRDAAGNKGLIGDVEWLKSRERLSDRHLKIFIAIMSFASAITVATITNLDRIESIFGRRNTVKVQEVGTHHHGVRNI